MSTLPALQALQALEVSDPSRAQSLRRWLGHLWQGVSDKAVRVLVDRSKRLVSLAADILPAEYRLEHRPAVLGIGTPGKQVEAHLRRGRELLSSGEVEEVRHELEKAAELDARIPQAASLEILHAGARTAEMAADSRLGRVWLRYWPTEGEKPPEVALLLPDDDSLSAGSAAFAPVEGEEFLLATFENVPAGPFRILW